MLVRERPGEGLSVYMTRRSKHSRFVPDAYVFPGGTVDPGDRRLESVARLYGAPQGCDPALAVAALRELLEEAGVLIGCGAAGRQARPSAGLCAQLRRELAAGIDFAGLLARHELFLDARELAYYSNWITPPSEPLRFDVHFFVGRAPRDQEPAADALEVHDGRWFAPGEALARADRAELTIVFPTRKHLERLASFASVDELFARARERRVFPVRPYQRDDGEFDFPAGQERW
jgi:recombination protein RecT